MGGVCDPECERSLSLQMLNTIPGPVPYLLRVSILIFV